jgi:hypothetical protein
MANTAQVGQIDQVLNTGRIAYGKNGNKFYPMFASSSGYTVDKTVETEPLPTQAVAASTIVKSTTVDLTGVKQATFYIDHGRASTANFGTNGTVYELQVSQKNTGNDTWRSIATFTCASTACLAIAASADAAAAATSIVFTSGTSAPTANDLVFWANTTAATASEWMRVKSVSGTASFAIIDGLTNAQDSDTNIYTQAEHFIVTVDVSSITRARVLVNNIASGTTLAIYSRVACITEK